MARCLRCHAGNEWIEGHVPDEPSVAEERLSEALKHIEALLDRVGEEPEAHVVRDATAFLASTEPQK